jgi:hypothetical protein
MKRSHFSPQIIQVATQARTVSLSQIQFYFSKGLLIHPLLENQYKKELVELSRKGLLSLTPLFLLELFSSRLESQSHANQIESNRRRAVGQTRRNRR